jgi:hypothetical protein
MEPDPPRDDGSPHLAGRIPPGENDALQEGDARVGGEEIRVDLLARAETAAFVARAVRRVERKLPGLELRKVRPAIRTGVVFAVDMASRLREITSVLQDLENSSTGSERRLHGVRNAIPIPLPQHESVDDHGEVMILVPVELGRLRQVVVLAVGTNPHEAVLSRLLHQLAELALPPTNQRGEHLHPSALGKHQELVHDLRGGLPQNRLTAVRAVRDARPRPQEAKVVVDLRDGPHGGSWVPAHRLLLDGDGRTQALDRVDIGLFHEPQELPGIRGEGFDVPALAFRVNRVERQRGLPRPRQSRDDHQALPREHDVDITQIVLSGTPYHEALARAGGVGSEVGLGRRHSLEF